MGKPYRDFDENFFDIIDTEEKAYWLGYIAADGCICTSFGKNFLSITSKDIKHLDKWRKSINSKKPSTILKNKYAFVGFTSKKMIQDLSKYGIIQNKTYLLTFPSNKSVSDNFINHYIRGYFDGDGCIMIKRAKNGKPNPKIVFVGASLCFLEDLLIKLNIKSKLFQRKNTNYYSIYISRYDDVINIMKFIYKEATLFLERKKEKFDEILKLKNDWESKQLNRLTSCAKRYIAFGEEKTLYFWSKDTRCKVSLSCLRQRLKNGMNLELALIKKQKNSGLRNLAKSITVY